MKYPLIKNNILKSDLDMVIKLLSEDNPKLTNGPKVLEFEKKWSKWLGVEYSVFVNSGASANLLSISLLTLKDDPRDEIIVPPLTWISDISSVLQNNFKPVFVDIDINTLGMNTDKILEKITSNTRAVFLSHIQGFNAITDKLLETLKNKNIDLIEDVCESHGALHNNKKVGTFGWVSNFSFYYAHHMSTIEGGMVSTNDFETYEKLRMLRSHGMVREAFSDDTKSYWKNNYPSLNPDFIFAVPAYNVRNTEIGAVIGLAQLPRLSEMILKRNKNHEYFLKKLNPNIFFTDFLLEGSSNYAFNLVLRNKDKELFARICYNLNKHGIEFRVGSAGGGNQLRQPYLQKYIAKDYYKKFPNTEHIHFFGMYIGNYPDLKISDIDYIVEKINI